MAANHRKTIQLNAPLMQIISILRSPAFCSHLRLELKSENPTATNVWFRFHHGVSFSSWGEKITITVTPLSDLVTEVDAYSECGMPTQIIDMGKNKQNVCNILEYIEAQVLSSGAFAMQPHPPVPPVSAPSQPTPPPFTEAPSVPTAPPPQSFPQSRPAPTNQAPAMKFCTQCGKQISAESAFCCFCGMKQN